MAKDSVNRSNDLNGVELHQFSKGWSVDLDNNSERSEGYADAWNGRLYSHEGTLAFTSLKGSKFVYNNNNIKKYNGYYSFADELIVFAKGDLPLSNTETEEQTIIEIVVNDFNVNSATDTINGILFSSNYIENNIVIEVPVEPIDEDDFKQNLTEVEDINTIDVTFGGLFKTLTYMPNNPINCSINNEVPINNEPIGEMNDIIISFKFNALGLLVSKVLYNGYLNIPFNAVITTEGVDENTNYKRVYFSDYYNSTRVFNIKDKDLYKRRPEEFDIKTKGVLLSPRITSIKENGQLKAMTVFYVMKLFTENGQVSDFSPLSKGVKIGKGVGAEIIGEDISEITNKSVVIDCYIPDYKNFKEVQLVAIEFEAKDVPTTIRLVGTKVVNAIVSFEHFGSESEFKENITIADLFANSISWKYNSDFTTKNNKMLVSGLRNDPLFLNSKNVALDFSLSSFDENGNTHTSLLNPDPLAYNLINNNLTEAFFYVQRKLYRKIEVFGNFKIKLQNTLNADDFYEFIQTEVSYEYVDHTKLIGDFLLVVQLDPNFLVKFPNLHIKITGGKILFEPIDPLVITDFHNYNLVFSTSQVIIDLDNDIENKVIAWPTTNQAKEAALVYGGVSNGWFSGNGVKVTMHSVKENVLSKNTQWMSGTDLPLKIKEPVQKKCVMKGEIYRLGIQWYKNGNRLFSTILGDLKIPDIGQKKRELDVNGNIIISSDTYKNWSVDGNEMYAEKIELQFDIRLNCELSKEIDAYQIVYVERTENNRTILAQGISAPLERMADFGVSGQGDLPDFEETIVKKWSLPSNGGPVYDYQGLLNFDTDPNFDYNGPSDGNAIKAITTNRKSFYFDSPDLVYDKISSNFVASCILEYIESIATDHDRHNIMGGYNAFTCGNDLYHGGDENDSGNPGCKAYSITGAESSSGPYNFEGSKFSQKIPSNLLAGNEKTRPFWVNASVFANRLKTRTYTAFQNTLSSEYKYLINNASEINPGEILSGYKLNDNFDYANHALSLGNPGWYYGLSARRGSREHSTFKVYNIAQGRKSIFIKTKENFFTTSNIAQTPYTIKSKVNFGEQGYRNDDQLKGQDSYIVSNLKRNNNDSLYGGRSEFAYSSNEYIPLSDVIPVTTNRIVSQIFYVEGDTYCSLYLRNKTSYQNSKTPNLISLHWDNFPSTGGNSGQRRYQYNKYNAWCYAVVLESTVEPRFTNSEEFYLFSKSINFNYEELYNSAYLQENNLRKSIPIPYNFKDNPMLENIIAVSNTKLSGDYVDAWTQFLTNEFYELDKNKGAILNIVKEKNDIYAIQKLQTSKIYIDEKKFITPDDNGAAIQISQGNGTSISGHEIISDYGTSFRRAVVENPFGFVFFDELKNEIVKIIEPLLVTNNLALEAKKMFDNNKVIGIEGFYDDEFKETNLRFRTEKGINFIISYNELLKVFNGKYDFENDLYFVFQNKVFAPYDDSQKIGQLNNGEQLKFFGNQKNLKLKVISAPQFYDIKINKGISVYTNTNYPLLKTTFITSLEHLRIITNRHHWYKIREGLHTLPAKNPTDYDDIRGTWCSIEIESEIVNNKEVKFFSILNFFRKSY
jgi:hypothetical protein